MKIVFFSDVHGCIASLDALESHLSSIVPDYLVLLGDALYHGPRNAIPLAYDAKNQASWLNRHKENMIAVRGNCDAEVDQVMLDFPMMSDYSNLLLENKRFFLTHGHLFHPEKLLVLPERSVFAFGHTHIPMLEWRQNILLFNPGSLGIPKGGFPSSFGVWSDNSLSIRTLKDGELLFDPVTFA